MPACTGRKNTFYKTSITTQYKTRNSAKYEISVTVHPKIKGCCIVNHLPIKVFDFIKRLNNPFTILN